MQTPERRIAAQRSLLLLHHGFFGMLAMRLETVLRDDIPTMAVDGRSIFYNPKFVQTLPDAVLRAGIAHEVMHCVLDHIHRRAGRHKVKWNQAIDYVDNQILQDSGFELGKGWLIDPKYNGMTAEAIYNLLPDLPEDQQNSFDECMDGSGETAEQDTLMWKLAAVQAAKAQGKLPASLQRFVDELVKPKVNWRERLRNFVTQRAKDDFSWTRPNRRYLSYGLYMPSLYSEKMGPMVVGVDTSGSITRQMLDAFAAEIRAIQAAAKPSELHVVYCDSRVAHVDTFSLHDEVQVKMHGGGGTAFKPVFDWVREKNINPECLVYLTDLYGQHNFAAPSYPTLWCCTTDQTATFGETLHVEI